MNPVHFYHVWAATRHPEIVDEHLDLLLRHKFPGVVYIGLVGTLKERENMRSRIFDRYRSTSLSVSYCASKAEGYEQPTIRAMHQRCKELPADMPVLYTHAKGSYSTSGFNDNWRRTMDERLVPAWPEILGYLSEADTVGMYWREAPKPHFSGNFWWATAGYLASLPEVTDETRYDAEFWIGQGKPSFRDLDPVH